MMSSQPLSFYFGVPLATLVVHPYRPDFSDELLPKLHAELWSDWFGGIHNRQSPTRTAKVTASTQSVLGLFADALAIGGLALLALPAFSRVIRRRDPSVTDVGLALLVFVAVSAFAGFTAELIRFPQQTDDPIKSSYLLFTTPCWAIFSVAAWTWLRSRRPRLGAVLVAVAGLYVISYGVDLGNALAQPSGQRLLGGAAGFVDLQAQLQQNSPNPGLGGNIDFLAGVTNVGDQTAGNVVLTVRLPAGHASPRPALLRARIGLHGKPDDRLPARLPRRRHLDADPLFGAGHWSGAADDHGDRELRQSRREPRRQHDDVLSDPGSGLTCGADLSLS